MANQKLQVARALKVFKSNNADIPFPNISASGANGTIAVNKLIDSSASFIGKVGVGEKHEKKHPCNEKTFFELDIFKKQCKQ